MQICQSKFLISPTLSELYPLWHRKTCNALIYFYTTFNILPVLRHKTSINLNLEGHIRQHLRSPSNLNATVKNIAKIVKLHYLQVGQVTLACPGLSWSVLHANRPCPQPRWPRTSSATTVSTTMTTTMSANLSATFFSLHVCSCLLSMI